jgi:ABC-type transport system involved in cytochrome c biogenesis permease component
MVWLPVVERELRVASRKHATYRIRVLALLAVSVVLAWAIFVSSQQRGLSGPGDGQALFTEMAYPAGIFSILIGVFATSDSIGVEKREGTLGLLFLTDLKGYDVVFGKLIASSLNGFYALIAVLPVLGVPLLVGGVTFPQFLELTVGLVTAIVFSLSAGIFVSAFQQSERKAMFMTCALLLCVTFIPFWVSSMAGSNYLWLLSPAYPVALASYGPPIVVTGVYWCSLAALWLMTILMLSLASNRVPGSCQQMALPAAPLPVFRRRHGRANRQLLALNPFAWLAARGEADPRLVWVFLASMAGIWLFYLWTIPSGMRRTDLFDEVVGWTDLAINTVLKVWIISESSRRFAEDRRTGAFELLLSTPLTVRQIIEGQWLALWRQFAAPIFAVLAWDAFLARAMYTVYNASANYEHFVAMFFLGTDAIALSLAGMWLGLATQSRNRAILLGILLVLTMPWLASVALGEATASISMLPPRFNEWNEFVVWGLADGLMIFWAASRIREHFRRVATEGWTSEIKN